MPWRAKLEGPLGKSFRRHFLPRMFQERERGSYQLSTVNQHRLALGLAALDSLQETERLIQLRLAFFPDWYAPRAADWPELEQVGFPLPASRAELPPAVRRLLEMHGRPLVFTPGTGVADVELFFAAARRCCELLDRPAVFLSPRCPASQTQDPRVMMLDYVDLSVLLPHAALLVHHGGMGTTARALEAGIPQIICPHGYDQPDNGARVADLGVGAVAEVSKSSGEAWAALAHGLVTSERVAARLCDVSSRLSRSCGLTRAADLLLERFAAVAS
jgi:rhamnosyltransferase subunit B